MTELDLHEVWNARSIPITFLKTTEAKPLSILHFGYYNQSLAGPDFSSGIIHLDGVDLFGPIELHIKSSDWYLHKHHIDKNYNNVILHVVYEHDVDIIQDGRKVPTLELKRLISLESKTRRLNYSFCHPYVTGHRLEFENAKMEAYKKKLDEKLKLMGVDMVSYHREVVYKLLASAFGSKVNSDQFLQLCDKVPIESLVGLSSTARYTKLIEASGFYDKVENGINWNYKGTRPSNFPSVRVDQFCNFVANAFFDEQFMILLKQSNIPQLVKYIHFFYKEIGMRISKSFLRLVLINIVPLYMWNIGEKSDETFGHIQRVLERVGAENNIIIRKWKKYGVSVKNAYDSQALYALYKYSCCRKKCLSCSVGNKLINSQLK